MNTSSRNGSVLVAVLWCLALLFVVVISVLHTARIDLLATKHFNDRIQAHYLALAGIEKAKALVWHDARERTRSSKSHTRDVYEAPRDLRDIRFARGQFTVFRPGSAEEGGGVVYGVSDEESRLNVNYAPPEELTNLFGITPDVVAAIVDWRDDDNTVSPGGAELGYYASMLPPRRPRNGPFETVRELLMVRGVSPEQLLGRDVHQNGMIDDLSEPGSRLAGPEDSGWAAFLTAHSSVDNLSAAGTQRLNIQTADEAALSALPGVSTDLARAIVRYRNQKRFETIFDLLDVTALQDPAEAASRTVIQRSGRPVPGPQPSAPQPGNPPGAQPAPTGPKLVSPALLMDIADEITTQSNQELPGVLNVNSASLEALICLPGISREIAQSIINFRQSTGFFPNIAHLLKIPGITQDMLKRLGSRLTARSETYRIRSEGRVASTGARQRIEEVVHVGLNELRTLEYRENDL